MVKKRKAIVLFEGQINTDNYNGGAVSTELRLYDDPWKIKKKITDSDLGSLCRLILPSEKVEKHVLSYFTLNDQEKFINGEIRLKVMIEDMNTHSMHALHFRRWMPNKSYVLQTGWSTEFVKRRDLKADDEVGLFWNKHTGSFYFSVFEKIKPHTMPSLDLSLREFGGDLTLGLPT